MIYFISDGVHVKVGYTGTETSVMTRLYNLQVGNPRPLRCLKVYADD